MESEAQSEPASTEVAQDTSVQQVEQVEQVEQVPESFNIFSDEPSPTLSDNKAEPVEGKPKKSKQFLENLKRDKQVRQQQINLKQREHRIAEQEAKVRSILAGNQKLKESPEEFFKAQGLDPMKVYKEWTERMINSDGEPSFETMVDKNREELQDLKNKIKNKEENELKARHQNQQITAFNALCKNVEQFAVASEGFETIKDTCTAKDIVSGMVTHYRQTGEELTIEEAFEKIESGLRQREESFYKDPKIVEKLRRYNPEASKMARGPQATLSARFKEQPTRTDPNDMSYEEIREMYKGKLFT